jgi:hypothetical protein
MATDKMAGPQTTLAMARQALLDVKTTVKPGKILT